MSYRAPRLLLALAVLVPGTGCSGRTSTSPEQGSTASASGDPCEQQANGGLSTQECTCAAMVASPPSSNPQSTVGLVASTTSEKLDPKYDVGLPAGTPVCFVAMKGEVHVSSPPGSGAVMYPYSFAIFTESPWRLTESGAVPTQPTPGSE